jgi:hypothetical protein
MMEQAEDARLVGEHQRQPVVSALVLGNELADHGAPEVGRALLHR